MDRANQLWSGLSTEQQWTRLTTRPTQTSRLAQQASGETQNHWRAAASHQADGRAVTLLLSDRHLTWGLVLHSPGSGLTLATGHGVRHGLPRHSVWPQRGQVRYASLAASSSRTGRTSCPRDWEVHAGDPLQGTRLVISLSHGALEEDFQSQTSESQGQDSSSTSHQADYRALTLHTK